MSWCDKLAATAAMGVKFDTQMIGSGVLLDRFTPLLNSWLDGEKVPFNIEQFNENPFGLSFITDDGFLYGVDASRAHVSFRHRMRARSISGGHPTMEMLSQPLPYTELLEGVSDKLLDFTLLVPNIAERNLLRVGVIAKATVDRDDFPPGIERFYEYIGRPWRGEVDGATFSITGNIQTTSRFKDRCIHKFVQPDDGEELCTLEFDWQRILVGGMHIGKKALEEIFERCRIDALGYFEELAEGSRFDEEFICEPA